MERRWPNSLGEFFGILSLLGLVKPDALQRKGSLALTDMFILGDRSQDIFCYGYKVEIF